MKYTLQQPGRSTGTIDIENFQVFDSWRLQDYRAGLDNVLVFSEKMVQSAAIKLKLSMSK